MAVIAVYSVNGGVGKTTIAANLAWCSAVQGEKRTLLWDLDPSSGAAFLFGVEPKAKKKGGAAGIFRGKEEAGELILPSGYWGLDLLPADDSLRDLHGSLTALGKKKRLAKLAGELSEQYERIILDCPPVLNEVSAQVIRAADVVIVPLPPSPLAQRALQSIRKELAANHKRHPPILPVLSMFDARRGLHKQLRAGMPDWPVIPMSSAIEQVAERQAPLGSFAPNSPSAAAFSGLWQAIEAKLEELGAA
ncbi:ParA family protein [Altererythrobacter fulvus]|uniref:ParA family protein n=1 Tax=Caenibius fulvus TaxID=2126012 RepID=UPI0030178FB0